MPAVQSERLQSNATVTTGVVSKMLGIAPQTVRGMCERGEFPGARLIGSWWRIPIESVRQYLPDHRSEVAS